LPSSGFKGRVQLVLGAEKQTTLQLEDDRLATLLLEQFHILTQAHAFRKATATVHLATNHGAAQLFTNEQEHGQGNADARCRNQAVTHRHGDHRDDDDEVHHGPRRLEQVQTVPVDHPHPDDDQDAGQCAYRDPGNECAQGEKRHQRHDAFDDPGDPRLPTARQIDQRCTHLASARHATGARGSDIPQTLGNQLAIGIVAAARQGIEHDGRLERIDRKQDREGKRGSEQAADLTQFEFADFLPTPGDRLEHA
jgi:hypothetical protein